jgi:hypothetical protein
LFDRRFQIAVGGGDNADVGFELASPADPLEFPLLQDAQQLGLLGQRHFADFIQKERAALRDFKLAFLLGDGPGECAFLVTEQFAFEQRLGQRRAVDRDERRVCARAVLVNGARGHLLACAALAENQDGGISRRDAGDAVIDFAHALALADHVVA